MSSFTGADAIFYYQEGITLDCSASTTGTLAQASFSRQATVAANCFFTVDDINFGAHGLIESEVIAHGAINLSCTPGANYTVARDGGLTGPTDPTQRLMRSGNQHDSLRLHADAAHTKASSATGSRLVSGTYSDSASSIIVYGRVALQPAATGQYSDTVVVTITYL